jgi:hypothetical protein
MDDLDRIRPSGDLDDTEAVEAWPEGLLARYATGAYISSGNARSQDRKLGEPQRAEEERAVPVPVVPEVYGYGRRKADKGAFVKQNEADSDELKW